MPSEVGISCECTAHYYHISAVLLLIFDLVLAILSHLPRRPITLQKVYPKISGLDIQPWGLSSESLHPRNRLAPLFASLYSQRLLLLSHSPHSRIPSHRHVGTALTVCSIVGNALGPDISPSPPKQLGQIDRLRIR